MSLLAEAKESQIKKVELIVKLCKEHKLNKDEKEACKQSLKSDEWLLQNDTRVSEELKKDIEKFTK